MKIRMAILAFILLLPIWLLADDERSSQNNAQLKKWLEKYPAADADKDGILTFSEAKTYQRERLSQRGGDRRQVSMPKPTHADVKYGPHRLQAFDIWLADSDEPTPLVLFIHGGGFRGGDKQGVNAGFLNQCLEAGYSFASINYRMIPEIQFPVPMIDSGRAIQLIRHRAGDWNIDSTRIASTGGSAGGGISLWLAFHDDLADATNEDPIARQSTRLACVAVSGAQSSYDYRFTDSIGLPGFTRHSSVTGIYGVDSVEGLKRPEVIEMMEKMSPINHLSKDDPAVLMDYGVRNVPVDETTDVGTIVHHPKLGLVLQAETRKLDLECVVQFPGSEPPQQRVSQFVFIKKCFDREDKQ
ncbi:MAG: alpha/beta hydrolase [Planctomycetes bacterium]|nr:alpha/beta hydrolase [Planctomycetota bacterium]